VRRKLLIGVGVAALLVLVTWLAFAIDWRGKEVEHDLGWTLRARRDPLLAARFLFERLGIPVADASSDAPPPEPDAVVFASLPGRPMPRAHEERWRDWIESGGQLVLSLPYDGAQRRRLANLLEDGRYEIPIAGALGLELFGGEIPTPERSSLGPREDVSFTRIESIEIGSRVLDLGVPADGWRFDWTDLEADNWIVADDEVWAVWYTLGRGSLCVIGDDMWLANDGIGVEQNAALLAELGSWGARVLLLRDQHREPLLAWLYGTAWPGLLALGIWLALWIWNRMPRQGPWQPAPASAELSFVDHLGASGAFLWRRGARAELLEPLRRALRARLERRRPELAGADARAVALAVAAATGQDPRVLEEALGARRWNTIAFVRAVRALVQAREKL
jgi:hypothetical protein